MVKVSTPRAFRSSVMMLVSNVVKLAMGEGLVGSVRLMIWMPWSK